MIKKIKPKSPDPYLSKTVGDNALARIAHVNQLVDQINNNSSSTYKVYTALLTQNGGNSLGSISGGDLTIGVTYFIYNNNSAIADFTNVGAPNNNVGTYFVATGTTPNNWDTGILEFNGGAPVATVLENTIGNIWFTYDNVGQYSVNSSELFTTDKTFIVIVSGTSGREDVLVTYFNNNNQFSKPLYATRQDNLVDSSLLNASLEIRVYN
jgi:hypothetical protein